MDYVITRVKLPKEWFGSPNDLDASVSAYIEIVDHTWEVTLRVINFPGWHIFNLDQKYKQDLYELVESKCIEKYIQNKEIECNYVL